MKPVESSPSRLRSFLDLPAEIREKVYGYYLFGEDSWNPKVETIVSPPICHYDCEPFEFPTEIFRLNKFISEESTHFFYSRCNFSVPDKPYCKYFYLDRDRYDEDHTASMFSSMYDLHRFLCSIGAANRHSMRSLEFDFWLDETLESPKGILLTKGFKLLSKDHALRIITLKFQWEPCWNYFMRDAERMEAFSDIRGLDKLKICWGETTDNEAEFPHKTFVDELDQERPEEIARIFKMVKNAQSKNTDENAQSKATDQITEPPKAPASSSTDSQTS